MITEEMVYEKLKECYDPEIPVNVVDLGLIYDVKIQDTTINVKMTLTAVGCPLYNVIGDDVKNHIMEIENVKDVNVEIVWDPPWNPDMMSVEAKKILGWNK
jgi:metal-sulfur cluster biosynthetic enzyme